MQDYFQKQLSTFAKEFKDLNLKYDTFNSSVTNMAVEIKPKDLENKEILPILADYIDKLGSLNDDFNRIKMNLNGLAA